MILTFKFPRRRQIIVTCHDRFIALTLHFCIVTKGKPLIIQDGDGREILKQK